MTDVLSTPSQRRAGFTVHLFTATGALVGFLALQAAMDGRVKACLLWLILCQVVDGVDGPIARKFDVQVHAPHVDGHVLDLVIDYVTCVVVPVTLMHQLTLVPERASTAISALILVTAALWFARTDQETDDVWFNGFPAMWNIVIPSFLLLETPPNRAAVYCVFFAVLQLTHVKFPHVMRVRALRVATYSATIVYFGAFIYMSTIYPHGSSWAKGILLIAPAYLLFIVVWRTWFPHRVIFGHRIA